MQISEYVLLHRSVAGAIRAPAAPGTREYGVDANCVSRSSSIRSVEWAGGLAGKFTTPGRLSRCNRFPSWVYPHRSDLTAGRRPKGEGGLSQAHVIRSKPRRGGRSDDRSSWWRRARAARLCCCNQLTNATTYDASAWYTWCTIASSYSIRHVTEQDPYFRR